MQPLSPVLSFKGAARCKVKMKGKVEPFPLFHLAVALKDLRRFRRTDGNTCCLPPPTLEFPHGSSPSIGRHVCAGV